VSLQLSAHARAAFASNHQSHETPNLHLRCTNFLSGIQLDPVTLAELERRVEYTPQSSRFSIMKTAVRGKEDRMRAKGSTMRVTPYYE
jgi:hypothetical protein